MNKSSRRRSYIHPEGWRFAAIFFSTSILLLLFSKILATIGFIFTAFVIWFFRDPKRSTPQDSNLVISSADGKVCLIDEAFPPEEVPIEHKKMKRICVFMNVLNVHVNRSPIAGKVEHIIYK